MLSDVNRKEIFSIYITFLLGLLGGGIVDYFKGFSKPSLPICLPIPDYQLFLKVIEVNFTFAIIIFILGINRIIQRIVILIVSFVMGEIVFTFGFLIGLIGTLPHGILELFGFSLIAYAGQKFRCKNKPIMLILIGFTLLLFAAFIESSLTIYVLEHILLK
ncbi:hypothetical protein DDW13_05220 [Acidianus hospitalis]|uniref:Stage II sporulation protein M n=1 Tax=Acidianus hospitalis TaxID=563177 RepID=A0A2T9X569_9CREN|nr:hypothetical protein DDW13_05220 [Acidianus hospitalis]